MGAPRWRKRRYANRSARVTANPVTISGSLFQSMRGSGKAPSQGTTSATTKASQPPICIIQNARDFTRAAP